MRGFIAPDLVVGEVSEVLVELVCPCIETTISVSNFLDEGLRTMILRDFEHGRDAFSYYVHMRSCKYEPFPLSTAALSHFDPFIGQSTVRAGVVAVLSRALARSLQYGHGTDASDALRFEMARFRVLLINEIIAEVFALTVGSSSAART